jgi:hypothetical protein
MAISPQDAAGLGKDDLALAKAVEQEIDKILRSRFTWGRTVEVRISELEDSDPGEVNAKVVAELARRYEAVGWKVAVEGDGEAAVLRFTADAAGPKPEGRAR